MTSDPEFQPGAFCWVDLMSTDMNAARDFYGQLFGWECQMQDTQGGPPYGVFTLGGKGVAGIGEMDADMKASGMPPVWNSYVHVRDVESTTEQARGLGASVTVGPMKVAEAGWLAFLVDPTGAHFALWGKNQHAGAEYVNGEGAFCWNELSTKDLARAKEFYGALFGWHWDEGMHMPDGRPYIVIMNEGQQNGGMMEITPEMGEVPPSWLVYFTVGSCERQTQRVSELGGQVYVPAMDIGVGKVAVVTDPQGGAFALFEGAVD
jgi:hypothetical protein